MSPVALGYLLALLSAVAGAARYNLAVFADGRGFEYAPFLAGALAVGLVCSLGHVAMRDGVRGVMPQPGRRRHALFYGVLMAWSTLSHFLALRYLNETVVASVSQVSILVTIALAVWLLGERFSKRQWAATIVIVGGVFLMAPWRGEVRWKGFLIVASGLLAGAFATVGAKRWVVGTTPRVLIVWRNAVALVVVGVYVLLGPRPTVTAAGAIACVAAGVLGPYLHGLFFLQALERIDAGKAALTNRIQPVIVFLLSWIALDRLPAGQQLGSAALLVAGTVWLAIESNRSDASPR